MKQFPLRRVNTLLLIAIILINGYILFLPLFPSLGFWWATRNGNSVQTRLHEAVTAKPNSQKPQANQADQLIIPSMLLDEAIHVGKSESTLHKGLWLRPQGSTPDKGGNTVIVGHRFTYTNPRGSLYHLDKVSVGDEVGLFWQGKKHIYRVREVKVVKANEINIEQPTTDSRLTIYTCTPLWLPKDRLVVIAEETTL